MSTILDHQGKPFQRAQLSQPQTAHMAALHTEYENHPSRGLTPARLASILQRAERGDLVAQHELFQDMEEKDAHLFSELQKRRLALQTLDWEIVPPRDATPEEEKLTEYVRDAIGALADIEDLIFDMTDAIGHGFSAIELEWRNVDGQLLPMKATHRPQSWFAVSTLPGANRNQLLLRSFKTADGEPLWPFGWILHQHRARSGYLSRAGLFRVLAWPFLFKNYAVRDLAEFLEIYGLPLRLGTYHPSATEKDKSTLLRAVVNLGHDAAAIMPEGMKVEFKEAAKGEESPFNSMVSLMERSMSKAILGGTLTSGEGEHGTQALGEVHNEVRHDLKKADARQLSATLTAQLVYPILAVNKGLTDMRRCPRLVFDTQEPEDIKLYADAVPKLVEVGMRIKRSWAHEKLKIPEAQDDEPVLSKAPAPAPAAAPAAAAQHARIARLATQPTAPADELDELAGEMLDEWEETLGELVEPIEQALASATSFEDFSQALESSLAGLEPDRLVELLARGAFAARIWGRLNAPKKAAAQK
ncbi:DUF935 domain-containing protein [Variovorax sp. VNK109]|uniref:DUF935 domain-containing protein n=1 Tax=Variovorax sp. VNK109 TaxID=3400919 RepID=UPI003C013C04